MSAKQPIYLDHNSTTPCDLRVIDAMLPFFREIPGNAASRSHIFGWKAEEAVKTARQQIAALIGAEPEEIVFTSGATEAANLALKGIFEAYRTKGSHIVTVSTEHKAVLDTCQHLEKLGAEITRLPVDIDGLIDLRGLESAIRDDTVLVAVMWANNETGVLQEIAAIGEICARKQVLFFSDATQAVGKIAVRPREAGIHIMAFSAHKMYGPKGVGALYVSRRNPRVKIIAQIDGGGHERGMRSGTLNVPAIVGFGKAAEIAQTEMADSEKLLRRLRDKLETTLLSKMEAVSVNGHREKRMGHVTNLSFKFVDSESLMASFNQQLALSSGSACTSASLEPSYVLRAMGWNDHIAKGALRFSLGKMTTEAEIDAVIETVCTAVSHLRSMSPVWKMYREGIDVESLMT